MLSSCHTSKISLDSEIMLTARVLTHKLSYLPRGEVSASSDCVLVDGSSTHNFVPKFPINELWNILNSINGGKFSSPGGYYTCCESQLGASLTAEERSNCEEESLIGTRKDTSAVVPHPCSAFTVVSTKFKHEASIALWSDKVQESEDVKCCINKSQKYEKKNIYFKAVFRDIRKFFIEKLGESTDKVKKSSSYSWKYKVFEPSLKHLILHHLQDQNSKVAESKVNDMVGILAPFLNYNHYLISFKGRNEKEAQIILDCLQNFTLTKMKKVFQYEVIQNMVLSYHEKTISSGESNRFKSHKTMKKNPSKYVEVLNKIVGIVTSLKMS